MLTWDGYVDPRVLDGFTDQYDTGVDYEIHTSDPDSVNKLRAGQTEIWDIINLNNPWAREMMWPQGLIVELAGTASIPISRRCCRCSSRPTSGR